MPAAPVLAERVPDPAETAPPLAWRLVGEVVPDPRATEYPSEPWASEAFLPSRRTGPSTEYPSEPWASEGFSGRMYLSEPWASEALFSLFLPCTLQPIVEADAQKVYI